MKRRLALATLLTAAFMDLPRRAAESFAAQFDTVVAVVAVAEGCDALVAGGMMPAGVWL